MNEYRTIPLTRIVMYHDIPIRCVYDEQTHIWMIPVIDIATALKMGRGNLSRTVNKEQFAPHIGLIKMITPGGYQMLHCLSVAGITELLLPWIMVRAKKPEVQERVTDFKRWSNTMLASVNNIKGVSKLTPPSNDMHIQKSDNPIHANPIDIINDNLDIAEIAMKRSGIPKEVAHGYAWALAANQTGMELNVYASFVKSQQPPEESRFPKLLAQGTESEAVLVDPEQKADYERHFSLTKVSEILKLSNDKVRNTLETVGLIYYENGVWRLTKRGEQFGKMFTVYPGYPYSTQKRVYIKYNPDAIKVLKAYFGGDDSIQHPLISDHK